MPALASGLYEGTVTHRRRLPVEHAFSYRLFMCYLDLDELAWLSKLHPLWANERLAPARFCRRDHLGDPATPLRDAVLAEIASQLGWQPRGPIRLLTHLRYWGYCFNPLSLYYCYAEDGSTLEAVVAEVSNTPWGERHCYVLDARACAGGSLAFEHPKQHHVSPFLPMDMRYSWRLEAPGERLLVRIDDYRGDELMFSAAMGLRRHPLEAGSMTRALLRYPWMTARVIAAIYWQALRLLLKRVPYFDHPGPEVSLGRRP